MGLEKITIKTVKFSLITRQLIHSLQKTLTKQYDSKEQKYIGCLRDFFISQKLNTAFAH